MIRLAANKAHRLVDILRNYLPLSQPTLNSIYCAITYNPDFSSIYTKEDTSLVALTGRHPLTNVQSLEMFWDPSEHCDGDIHDFLLQIPTLQWGQPIYLYTINMSLSERMSKILASPDLIGRKLQKTRSDLDIFVLDHRKTPVVREIFENLPDDFIYGFKRMEPELEKKFRMKLNDYIKARIPENFEISFLREEDFTKALSLWYQRPVDSRNFVEQFRKYPAKAAYMKDAEGSHLAMFNYMSNLGIGSVLYTVPAFRKLGLSYLTTMSVSMEIIIRNIIPLVSTAKQRDDVKNMFSNSGLVKISEAYHEIYYCQDDPSVILPYF